MTKKEKKRQWNERCSKCEEKKWEKKREKKPNSAEEDRKYKMSMLSTQEIVLPHVAYYPSQPKDACIPSSPKFTPFCRSLNLYRLLLLLWLCRCHFICAVDFLCIFLEWHFFFCFLSPVFLLPSLFPVILHIFSVCIFFLGYFFPIVFLHRRHTHTHTVRSHFDEIVWSSVNYACLPSYRNLIKTYIIIRNRSDRTH